MTRRASLGLSILVMLVAWACSKVNVTAPKGARIASMNANPTQIPLDGGTSTITATLFEESGLPVADEIVVYWETNLGSIEGSSKTLDGIATATLRSTGVGGTATVRALSGNLSDSGAGGTVDVQIGVTSSSVVISATPASLPSGGGSVTLVATVFSEDGQPAPGAVLVFSTTEGVLASGGQPLSTNSSGQVTDTLTTSRTATVTATSGSLSSDITINVGTTGVSTIVLSADQVNLPSTGGTTNLVATVLGNAGPIPGVAVAWTSDAGTLGTAGVTLTDSSGQARNSLSTTTSATVTVSAAGVTDSLPITVGAGSGSATVSVSASRGSVQPFPSIPAPFPDYCANPQSGLPIEVVATVTDNSGNPIAGRQVTFYIDIGEMSNCGRAFGYFCGSGSASVVATTASDGTAIVMFSVNQDDVETCNCMQSTGCIMNPKCPSSCFGKCTSTEDQFCQVAIAAISGGVASTNVQFIEYNK